jgi:hypothetical protein
VKVKGWALLKKAVVTTTTATTATTASAPPSLRERDATSERGLREIIDMFQTRVLEGVPAAPRTSSLTERRSSGGAQTDRSSASSSKAAAAADTNDATANDDGSSDDQHDIAFQIQRKWTTDKFTTNRNRVEDMGRLLHVVLPLLDFIVIFLLLGELLLLPILVSFQPTDIWMYFYQVGLEVILILDFFKNLGTTIMHARLGLRQKDLSVVEKGRAVWLVLDVVAALPVNAAIGRDACMSARYMCSLPIALNFLKLTTMARRLKQVMYDQINDSMHRKWFTTASRVFRILVIILSTINLAACLWYFIGTHENDEGYDKDWFRRQNEDVIGRNYDAVRRTDRWVQSCYFTLLILVGDSVTPLTTSQHFFCAFMMLVGTIASAVLIGETANLLSNMSAARASFELKMEELDYMMGYLKLPRMLQFRVREYYTFLWEEHRCLDGDPTPFVRELSPAIRSEVDLFLKRGLILKSDLFVQAPFEFIRDVSSQLKLVFYLRGDYVVREGETGHSMYFISRGTLRVCIKGRFIKDMEIGDCFGEIAILRDSSRRSASVYAHTHATLYSLNRMGVHELASMHPGVLEGAIARHYTKKSPAGKRTSLVFGRRASATEFAGHLRGDSLGGGGEGALNMKLLRKQSQQSSLASPQGPHFIAIDSFDQDKHAGAVAGLKRGSVLSISEAASAGADNVSKLIETKASTEQKALTPKLPGETVIEHRRRASIVGLGLSAGAGFPLSEAGVLRASLSPVAAAGQAGCFPLKAGGGSSGSGETPKQQRRRQSQSLLGLEFRLKLVLNTLGLEKQAYQFALLGCTRASDVQFVRFVDLKGVSMVQFRRLQAMCDAGSGADDSSDESEGSGEDGE